MESQRENLARALASASGSVAGRRASGVYMAVGEVAESRISVDDHVAEAEIERVRRIFRLQSAYCVAERGISEDTFVL